MSTWLKRSAIVSLLGFPIALLATRFGILTIKLSMLIVLLSLLLALFTCLAGGFLSIKQRHRYPPSAKNALTAMLISLVPLIGLGLVVVGARDIPRIHNVSTDTTDPPVFVRAKELRTSEDNPLEYDAEILASIQKAAYPNLQTLSVSMSKEQAREHTLVVIDQLGWDLVDDNQAMSIIEATHTSRLWRFTDDIVIRFRSNQANDQVSIDLRSVSRVGQSDLGANAKRIEAFLTAFTQAIE